MLIRTRSFRYLDKCKQDVVLQLATIGEATWITLAVFVALSMYIQAIRNTTEMNIFLVVLVLALLPVLVVLLVREKVMSVCELLFFLFIILIGRFSG